jgi:hypothetical protein
MLLATALTGALAVPAIAGPATPVAPRDVTGSVSPAKKARKAVSPTRPVSPRKRLQRVRKAGAYDFEYDFRVPREGSKYYSRTYGAVDWGDDSVSNNGRAYDKGNGKTLVTYYLQRKDGGFIQRGPFAANDGYLDTDFLAKGDFSRVVVLLCKVTTEQSCEYRTHDRA